MANYSLWTSCLTSSQPVALPFGCGNLSTVSSRVVHAGVSMCVDKQATVDKFATLLAHFNDQVCACGCVGGRANVDYLLALNSVTTREWEGEGGR